MAVMPKPLAWMLEATFLKFVFFKKAAKMDQIFTVHLALCSKCQIDGEDVSIFLAFLENINFNEIQYYS